MAGGRREGGKREKKGKSSNIAQYFAIEKNPKEERANKYREGTGIKGYEKWEV